MAVTWRSTHALTGATLTGLSNGNLTIYSNDDTALYLATVFKRTGKWYWECSVADTSSSSFLIGVCGGVINHRQDMSYTLSYYPQGLAWRGDKAIYSGNTQRYAAATVGVSPGGGIVGVAMDCDLGRVWLARNNTWVMSGDPANNANPVADPAAHSWWPGTPMAGPACNGFVTTTAKFASGSLTYTPPSGFSALTDSSDWEGVVANSRIPRILRGPNYYFGGSYRIAGTVTEMGVPGPYRVRLFHRASALCLAETWSTADGAYVFNNLAGTSNDYFAVAYDHGDNPLNAAIADLITPEAMP